MNDSRPEAPTKAGEAGEGAKVSSPVNPAAILADLHRVIRRYSGITPHPSTLAAYLLQYRDALETVGDEAALAVIQSCVELGVDWGPALLALARRVKSRGGPQ